MVLLLWLSANHLFPQKCEMTFPFREGITLSPESIINYAGTPVSSLEYTRTRLDTNYILTNINVSRSPQQVLIPPGSHKAFVVCKGTAELLVIDLVTATVENSIILNCFPSDIIINANGSKIYISSLTDQPPINFPLDDCGSMGIAIGPSPIIIIDTQTQTIDTIIINNVCFKTILLNEAASVMYTIGCENYINAYDMNTFSLLHTYNLYTLSGYITQPHSSALATDANKLYLKSIIFAGSNIEEQIQVIDLTTNLFHVITYDTLGYSSSALFTPLMLSPDAQDIYIYGSYSAYPPNAPGTLIFDAETEVIKAIVPNLAPEDNYIPFSDSTAFFDDTGLFGDKTLFDFRNYEIINDLPVGGCSGAVSLNKEKLYLTQIGANHDGAIIYGSPERYDITIVSSETETFTSIFVADETFTCSYERTLAMTTDGCYLITTNSALNTVSILNILPPVSVPENRYSMRISIYPNPTSGVFTVDLNSIVEDYIAIQIIDVLGKTVFEESNIKVGNRIQKLIHLDNKPPGLYYLIAKGKNSTSRKKIVIR